MDYQIDTALHITDLNISIKKKQLLVLFYKLSHKPELLLKSNVFRLSDFTKYWN